MRDFLLACILFSVTTVVTLLLSSPLFPPSVLVPVITVLTLIMLGLLISLQSPSLKPYALPLNWGLLFLISLVIDLIVLSTGALYSPFLILLFLFALGISLVLSFPIALAFIGFSVLTLLLHMLYDPQLSAILSTDPVKAGIYLISFLIVLPLYHIITTRYHLKDKTLKHLSAEVNVEDSLLDEVHELVIVTDTSYHILSVNESVEKYLHRSRAEIIDQLLFDIVYLQDTNGSLITKDMLSLESGSKTLSPRVFHDLRLITTPLFAESVQLYMKPIPDYEGNVIQILFIISDSQPQMQTKSVIADSSLQVKIRYEAMIETLKKHLRQTDSPTNLYQFILITNFQHDLLNTQIIEEHGIAEHRTRVDLAKLCKQTLLAEQDFAQAFHVQLHFLLPDFSEKDVSPLVTNVMEIKPEEFTGPFFTTTCDTQYVRLIIQKLLDVATLLAANEAAPSVELRLERHDTTSFIISITAPSPDIAAEEVETIFQKFYGPLNTTTNLNAGSGLEGYLAKKCSEQLNLPLELSQTKNPSRLRWILRIPKNPV